MAVFWVAIGVEDAIEIGGGEDAFGDGFEAIVAEELVDAVSDPVGVEDLGGLEDGVVAEVEDEAEVVEESDQLGLVGFAGDALGGAEGGVLADGDEVGAGLFELFELLFDLEPAFGEQVVDFAQVGDFPMNCVAEFVNPLAGGAGGFEDGFDVGVFFLKGFAIDVERLFVGFVADDDDGGAVAEGFD